VISINTDIVCIAYLKRKGLVILIL